MMAGRNTNILGSDVAVEHDQLISAGQNLTIAAAQNTFENFNYERRKKSGLMSGGGGLSISIGTQENGQKNRSVVTQAAPSTVGSIQGDLRLIAGNDYVQTGSNVLALNGDIDILGRNVTIQEAREARTQTDQSWFKKTGLTIGVSNPVVSLAQTASDMAKAASKTSDGRMKLLAAATVGLAGKNAYDATNGGDPAAAAAVNISISLGTSKSSSQSISTSDTAASSTVLAGGDLTLLASGAGQDSDITVTGSKLSAGGNAILKADGDILLQAAKNVSELHSSNKSSGGSIGVGLSAGSSGAGVSVSASAHTGRGKADGVDAIWTNTQINAGHVLALQSGEDTTLRGASGRAERVVASVGGKLLIESLQDTSAYKSKNQNASASVSFCVAGACGNSISGNVSQTKMNSDFASVIEQSGLWAGNGGFQIDVDKNTSLIGGLIASNDQAIRDGLNRLDTGTLVVKDIENKAEYSASSVGVGGGYSFGGGSQTKNDLGVNQKGEVVAGANAVPGTSVPKDRNGLSVGMPMVAAASGSARSMTLSAISEGQIRIRDEAGQQALTGKTAAQTIAGLNRDTDDTLNSLSPIFNKEEIEAGFEIVGALTREAGVFLTNRANEAEAVRNELEASIVEELAKGGDPERLAQLDSQWKAAGNWAPGGLYRQITTALLGAAGGNVTGSTGQFVQSAAINYLQSEGAKLVKDFVASKPEGLEAEGVRAALHAIVGCAGAAAQNANCASGAAGAGLGSLFNSLMADDKKASPEKKEARNNLINALVAGVVTGLGGDAAAASTAARIETENNALYAKSKEVSKVLTPKVQELEQAFVQGEIDTQEYQRQRVELDILAAKVNGLAIVYGYRDGTGLAQSLSEMSVEHVNMLGEIVVGFLNVPGMAMSAYELITGKTVATDEEANSFFAALGILPGAGAAKAVLGLRALSKADDVHSVAGLKKIDGYQESGLTTNKLISDLGRDYSVVTSSSGGAVAKELHKGGATNIATYGPLKDKLAKENLANIAAQDPRLAAAAAGSPNANPNYSIGRGSAEEAERLKKYGSEMGQK